MRKILSSACLCLLLVVPLILTTHTEDNPFVTSLITDGGNPEARLDVGDISVWNDGDYLYVKYETTGDWDLTETHLPVPHADYCGEVTSREC